MVQHKESKLIIKLNYKFGNKHTSEHDASGRSKGVQMHATPLGPISFIFMWLSEKFGQIIEFSLNVFTEFSEFSDKNIIILKYCWVQTHYLLCEKQRLYHCATDTQLTEKTVKLEFFLNAFTEFSDKKN